MKKILLAVLLFLLVSTTAVFANVNCKILDKINEPNDIKTLNDKQLKSLAKDIRAGILNKTNLVGGHVGPDLGVVELTIAMHYVFNSPTDKFIFDTSHQTYPHKMLTGRKDGYTNPDNYLKYTANDKKFMHQLLLKQHNMQVLENS